LSAFVLLLLPAAVRADTVLRFASMAPEGTAWARELKAFARDVETASDGEVHIKWYLGGIAGDEVHALERIKKGQLDGSAGSITCSRLAPSLRVSRLVGMFRRYDEEHFVLNRLNPTMEGEFRKNGFVNLGIAVMGSEIVFARRPVQSLADLRKQRFWVWNLDDVWHSELSHLGLNVFAMPVEEAGATYDKGGIDGFLAIPTAALAYQWATRAHYFTRLTLGFLPACMLVSTRAFDSLPVEAQAALRGAGAKLGARFDEINRQQEELLLGGLFVRQGSHEVRLDGPEGERFRSEFYEEARHLRDQVSTNVVPRELLDKVSTWLADFRGEHR
jgi:TRAP-type C4-dicarboxylate transport system substrate-binding protein